ncbi:MAG TPA: hypothetical protein VER33_27655, partial [Polyangiaceae bacterium]|nr:hypothetical protein [Polyangiaceae bacterium]
MLKLASTQIHFVLATVATLALAACGGGDEDDGGNNNTGGSGGGGGSGTGSNVLVSDFETANGDGKYDGYSEKPDYGWKTAWFTYGDKSASAMIFPTRMMPFETVEDPARAPGIHVANAKGSGFSEWGAGMGFNFLVNGVNMPPSRADISAYKASSFWLKIGSTALNGPIQVKLVDFDHALVADGGGCTPLPMGTPMYDCNNTFQTLISTATSEWKQFTVTFAEMTEDTWGQKVPMDLKEVIGFQFQVRANTTFDFA